MNTSNVSLGQIAKFIRGVTYKPVDLVDNFSEDSVVCMRTANIQQELDESDLKSIQSSVVKSDEKYLKEGDILVSTANSWNLVGKCCWVRNLNYLAVPGGFIAALRVDERVAHARYVYHWFNSKKTQELARNCGRQTTNISNMDLSRCLSLELPLPSLPEQRRIATILDKAESLRAKRREAIAKLDQLLQSVFLEMFGDTVTNPKNWPLIRLADLISDGPQNGLYKPASEYGKGTPIVRIDGFQCGDLIRSNPKNRVNLSDAEKNKYGIKELDILINRVNSPSHLGKAALYLNNEDSVFESNMMRFSLNKEMANPFFINFYLKQKSIKNQILYSKKDASNQSSINQNDVANFIINLPPIEEQNYFCLFLKKVYLQKEKAFLSQSIIEDLINSMQSRFFN